MRSCGRSHTRRVDIRQIEDAVGDLGLCDLIEVAGGECTSCDDGEAACVDIHLVELTATDWGEGFQTSPDDSGC